MQEISIDPKELAAVYQKNTNLKAAAHFHISPTTLTKLLKQEGIPLKGRGGSKRIKIKTSA